ncbi:MAG: YcaO-like family protein [Candidatus Pacebacteria bacterium]|nr:YcaO-like family protein [Candidatus Paceibacterota bacterium]
MIFDAIAFSDTRTGNNTTSKALKAFADFMERKLGVRIVRELQTIPFRRPDLLEPMELAALLKEHGIIQELAPIRYFPDEPRMKGWYAICNDPTSHQVGGTTWDSDELSLYATLAEALERYIWMTQDDYFVDPIRATTEAIAKRGKYVSPHDFVGYSEEQRALHPSRKLRADAKYLWIRGTSLVSGAKIYVPAQTVSGLWRQNWAGGAEEPLIRQQNTNGLATWPTKIGARLAGALEVIEREAYMTMWLNQLSTPRISIDSLRSEFPELQKIFSLCEKFRMKVHVLPLPTDAPAHVVAVVVEDMSGQAPRFTIGLKAHTSLSQAVQKALTEALRAHRGYRLWVHAGNTWDVSTPVEKVGHRDRLYYWGVPEHAKHLEFMLRGPERAFEHKAWDSDTIEEHYRRIIEWCSEKNFECISVPLTLSAMNPTSLHIEMILIPQLHPTYLDESTRQFGGSRWRDVAISAGYTPRKKPYDERPHPFS